MFPAALLDATAIAQMLFVSAAMPTPLPQPVWRSPEGEAISCVEKLKVLRENLEEIQQTIEDALGDAVLMGCDAEQFRAVLREMIEGMQNPYPDRD